MISQLKIAAAYIRVSTEDQTEYSPGAQMAEIRKYAASHGYSVPDGLVFMDEGISGKSTGKRDAFNRMIGTAKKKPKPFDAILLWKFSRFARNREDSIVYKSMLRKQLGIDVISVSEPVGDDKMSILIEAMIEAMDEYYSINLAEEVRRGMTEKARRGGLQASPPFGYAVKDNILTPVPEEAAQVRFIFERFIAGESCFQIAKGLNDLGIVTHRGNRFESRTAEYILCNPAYIGKLRWNSAGRTRRDFQNENIILSDGRHEALIFQDTWEAAQRRMAEIRAQRKSHGRPPTEHKDWLSGLVLCADCGRPLVFCRPHYWKCNGYAHGICKSSQHVSDEKLKDMIFARLEHDRCPGVFISCSPVRPGRESTDDGISLKEQQKNIASRLARLREAYLAGVEELDGYRKAKSALERQAEEASRRLAQLSAESTIKTGDCVRQSIGSCLELLESPGIAKEVKYRAIRSIVSRCTYSKESNLLALTYRILLP